MRFPRLIIADERRAGRLPAGVVIAAALKEVGYRLRLFVGGVDETTVRALQVACGESVTVLDPVMCGSREAFRWLFQESASPDALNLIITELGARWSTDSPFVVAPECPLLMQWLDCEMVPIIYGGQSSVFSVRTIRELIKQLSAAGTLKHMNTMMLRTVPNPGEYDLIDQEVGRRLSALMLSALPTDADIAEPLLTDMCTDRAAGTATAVMKAASAVIGSSPDTHWPTFAALAAAAREWSPQKPLAEPIEEAGKVNVAVIRDSTLTLGGDGTERLMRALGIETIDIPLDDAPAQTKPLHGIYIPHGLAYLSLTKFFSSVYIKTLITRGSSGVSFMLAEGGSAPLLGETIDLPKWMNGGGSVRGFGAFKFASTYDSHVFSSPQKVFAFMPLRPNPMLVDDGETLWGYGSDSLKLLPAGGLAPCWAFMDGDGPQARRRGSGGFANGRMLASPLRIEPWSAPGEFRRWLEGGP